MHDNIGGKIKMLAKFVCGFGILVSIATGLLIMSNLDFGYKGLIIAILTIFVGGISSWIGSFCLYGYGELIDQTTELNKKMDTLSKYAFNTSVSTSITADNTKKPKQ